MSIDPTSKKFKEYIPEHVNHIADFFSADTYRDRFGKQKAKVVTSFSMFYDLKILVSLLVRFMRFLIAMHLGA